MVIKKPTITGLVMEALSAPGVDFVEGADLLERVRKLVPGVSVRRNAVNAALFHLRKHHCVDVVIENDGRGWWYSTKEWDDRNWTCSEIKDGITRRRRRRVPTGSPSSDVN